MLVNNLLYLFTLAALALGQDVDDNDVPSQCRSVCASVTSLTNTCDRQNDDNDSGYINCVCSAQNANVQIPLCEACVAQFDSDGRDNDVNDLIRSCSFTTTSYNPSAASASLTSISGTQVLISNSASQMTVTTTSGTSTPISVPTSAPTPQTTGPQNSQSTGAAPTLRTQDFAFRAGMGMGVVGVVVGML